MDEANGQDKWTLFLSCPLTKSIKSCPLAPSIIFRLPYPSAPALAFALLAIIARPTLKTIKTSSVG